MAELDGFLTALALCHTVQVTEATADDLLPSYQASSPDEKALVEACSRSVKPLVIRRHSDWARDMIQFCFLAF